VFGKDVIELFDVKYEDFDLGVKNDHPNNEKEGQPESANDNENKKD